MQLTRKGALLLMAGAAVQAQTVRDEGEATPFKVLKGEVHFDLDQTNFVVSFGGHRRQFSGRDIWRSLTKAEDPGCSGLQPKNMSCPPCSKPG